MTTGTQTSTPTNLMLVEAVLVETAVNAIRTFAGDVDRPSAEHWLALWPHRHALSEDAWDAVLDRFGPARDLVPGADFLPAVVTA